MSLKKIIKFVDRSRKNGTLPKLESETVKTPFGDIILIKHKRYTKS